MRIRLPLYSKILAWFFLNLVVVAGVVVLIFDAQFHFNLDWFFTTGAKERMEAVRDLIMGELSTTSPDEWPAVMRRYSEAHHVQFALVDDEGQPFLGNIGPLPADVVAKVKERPTYIRPRSSPGPDGSTPAVVVRMAPRGPLRALMRTTSPTRYWLLTSARLDNPMFGNPMRVVLVGRSDTISAGGLILNPKPWTYLGLGIVAFSLLFWLPLIRGITRTLAKMSQATKQIADGRFDVRLRSQRHDELGTLAESINQMASRLDGLMKGQKRFLGDIAHELCSPLARLRMALGILEENATPEQQAYVAAASEKAALIAALVDELLSFSKASFGQSAVKLQPLNVRDVIDGVVRREATDPARISVDVPAGLAASADPELLDRALGNLLRNALNHGGADSRVEIIAEKTADAVSIRVADSGPGIPEEELSKIFDAFYRLDASRTRDTGGTGLGLTIVKTCIESCGGTVAARNRTPHGLEVVMQLAAVEVS